MDPAILEKAEKVCKITKRNFTNLLEFSLEEYCDKILSNYKHKK